MTYIKRMGDNKLPKINLDYKQVFLNKASETQSAHKTKIAEKILNGAITQEDIEVIKFIFKFGSVSLEQIYRFMSLRKNDLNEVLTISLVEKRLDILVGFRIIHEFILADNNEEVIRPDAFKLYCLNTGGAYALKNFSEREDVINWAMHKEIKDASKILKSLTTAEFYLDILETCPEKLEFFDTKPELRDGRTKVVPAFIFCLNKNGEGTKRSYYIGDIFNEQPDGIRDGSRDTITEFRKKIKRLEDVMKTSWCKGYGDIDTTDIPTLFVIGNSCEDDYKNTLIELSRIVIEDTEIDKFRLTSLPMINDVDLSAGGVFVRYDANKDSLIKIRAKNFNPIEEK